MYCDSQQNYNSNHSVQHLESDLFEALGLHHISVDIPVAHQETVHAVLVAQPGQTGSPLYFLGHGFGGSSLLHVGLLGPLLRRGPVVLWQVRGMGLSQKLPHYEAGSVQQIESFFLETISALLSHFAPVNSTFICHSFSAYLALLYLLRHPVTMQAHVKELVLLSPVGVTPREQDYKNSPAGFTDWIYSLIVRAGWNCKLSYKAVLRQLCCCLKAPIIKAYLSELDQQPQRQIMLTKVLLALVQLPSGSESLFYDFFEPRVLPRVALQPLMGGAPPVQVTFVYGGERDWVDKGGALRLANSFPQQVRVLSLPECSHNIPFHTASCLSLFRRLFQ